MRIYPPLPANQGLKRDALISRIVPTQIYPPLPANQGLKQTFPLGVGLAGDYLPTASCKPRIETTAPPEWAGFALSIYPPLPANQGLKPDVLGWDLLRDQYLPTASCKPRIETSPRWSLATGHQDLPTASCKPRIETDEL